MNINIPGRCETWDLFSLYFLSLSLQFRLSVAALPLFNFIFNFYVSNLPHVFSLISLHMLRVNAYPGLTSRLRDIALRQVSQYAWCTHIRYQEISFSHSLSRTFEKTGLTRRNERIKDNDIAPSSSSGEVSWVCSTSWNKERQNRGEVQGRTARDHASEMQRLLHHIEGFYSPYTIFFFTFCFSCGHGSSLHTYELWKWNIRMGKRWRQDVRFKFLRTFRCFRSPDYTKGIFQSIGFKEFHNYLILPEDERRSEKVNFFLFI